MGHWVKNDEEEYYQFDDKREMLAHFGIDIDTMEGDYGEAFHHLSRQWNKVQIDKRFYVDKEKDASID